MRDFHQHTSDHMDMSKLYSRETDRSAALLSTSFLDTVLEEVLKSFFVDDKNTDKLFQGYAPLSSFSAKIDIMYALGLINKDMLTDISTVRKIRNHFAHSWQDISFDKSPISALCTNFLTTRTLFFTKSGVYGVILVLQE